LEKKMTDQMASEWSYGDKYSHPDGTVFTRSKWGTWYGSDGSNVNDPYIDFMIRQASA
jgi:hypothetical protein